jgi:hypothetical protein
MRISDDITMKRVCPQLVGCEDYGKSGPQVFGATGFAWAAHCVRRISQRMAAIWGVE